MSACAATHNKDGQYYVYALVDPIQHRRTGDQMLSIFYVGKRKDSRVNDHVKAVRAALRAEQVLLDKQDTKAQRIRQILEFGEPVEHLCLSHGYGCSGDAERAESLAIEVIGRALAAAGGKPLTNASKKVDSGFGVLGKDDIRISADLLVGPTAPEGGARRTLLVKGTTDAMEGGDQRVMPSYTFASGLDAVRDRITVFEWSRNGTDFVRPGWDSLEPWDDLQARERGRRYWPLGKDTVNRWIKDPDTCPEVLLLGIPTADGRTIVRYAWDISSTGKWEYFPESSRWGVPLGERLLDHPALNMCMVEDRGGKRVQVLLNHAAGWRVLDV